ncbi:MAG: DNA cytosine methyltransferase [Thermoplasmatales archaeon]
MGRRDGDEGTGGDSDRKIFPGDCIYRMMGKPRVLDLFCGMGGLSSGFAEVGFSVTGSDISEVAGAAYRKYTHSKFIQADLSKEIFEDEYDYVVGGPPCRPWSSVNLTNRGDAHRDYGLVKKFADNVLMIRPEGFVLENVPPLQNDPTFNSQVRRFRSHGYTVKSYIFRYSDFGAATSRRRLFVIGLREGNLQGFESAMISQKRNPGTVRSAIGELTDLMMGEHPDHQWPNLRTIKKYAERYDSGKFGWAVLKWDIPAPSFGNVMKTYTLHPDSDPRSGSARVVSPLEVSRIMGFDHGFSFPDGTGMARKYQMLADSVSPVFSRKIASALLVASRNPDHRK